MQSHLVIGAVQVRLVAAGAIHTSARIVGNDKSRRAQTVFESGNVTFYPVAQILAERGMRKGVIAGAENGNKQRGPRDLAGALIVDRDGVASPVHEHLLAGAMLLAQHHISSNRRSSISSGSGQLKPAAAALCR